MNDLLLRLKAKERRGSKPRCHWLTHGDRATVAARLTALGEPWLNVSEYSGWMPDGFNACDEAELHKATALLDGLTRQRLAEWWLPAGRHNARTPNFDIASTCVIDGRPGLLLVEAKAHADELEKEAAGRVLLNDASQDRRASHETIGKAISAANDGLSAATALPWQISRDSHYQMSNRFAWSWKLTELGVPVVLVYLGFLNATEMIDCGKPLLSHESWESLVRAHSTHRVPADAWNRRWSVNGVPFIPLIRSLERPFDKAH